MRIDEQRILDLSREIWSNALGLHVSTDARPAGGAVAERTWSSRVTVSGPWQGAILVECPESIARHAAATFFEVEDDTPAESDIEQALSELVRRVASKIAALLPPRAEMSHPSVADDARRDELLAGLRDLAALRLSCEGRPVRIAVMAAEPELAAATEGAERR